MRYNVLLYHADALHALVHVLIGGAQLSCSSFYTGSDKSHDDLSSGYFNKLFHAVAVLLCGKVSEKNGRLDKETGKSFKNAKHESFWNRSFPVVLVA